MQGMILYRSREQQVPQKNMNKFYDGMEITRNELPKDWIMVSQNNFTKAVSYVDTREELGVTFYEGYEKGNIYRV